jgi:hypothetical protein
MGSGSPSSSPASGGVIVPERGVLQEITGGVVSTTVMI